MIYLPWAAFLIAIVLMIRRGDKAKEEYRRRKAEEEKVKQAKAFVPWPPTIATYATYGLYAQGQGPELRKILGSPETSRTSEQERGPRWKQ